jgi:hypothetical protein
MNSDQPKFDDWDIIDQVAPAPKCLIPIPDLLTVEFKPEHSKAVAGLGDAVSRGRGNAHVGVEDLVLGADGETAVPARVVRRDRLKTDRVLPHGYGLQPRNSKCRCGSGKKFKHCCGGIKLR